MQCSGFIVVYVRTQSRRLTAEETQLATAVSVILQLLLMEAKAFDRWFCYYVAKMTKFT